jgi:hypothetical protein
MGELTKLPNIAEKLEGQLAEVGITTFDELNASAAGKPGSGFSRATLPPASCGFRRWKARFRA